jgi:hypothetical protein
VLDEELAQLLRRLPAYLPDARRGCPRRGWGTVEHRRDRGRVSGALPKWTPMKVVFGWRASPPLVLGEQSSQVG